MRFSRKEDEEILRAYRLGIFFEDMGNHLENLGFINRSHDAYRIRIDQIIRNQAVRDQAVRAPVVRSPIIREKKSALRRYTEAEIEAVRKLAAQGFSWKEIPLEMQKIGFEPRNKRNYKDMAYRKSFNIHNSASRKYTEAEIEALRKLAAQGFSWKEIPLEMQKIGFEPRNKRSYKYVAARNSYNIHSCKFTPEENAVIKSLIEQGMEMMELQTAMIRRGFPLRKEATYGAWINYIGEWDMDAGNGDTKR